MTAPKTARVLVVDDEPDLCELLQDALGGEATVLTAQSGAEAMRLIEADRPDVLITDMRLGDCTGLDVVDSLRCGGPEVPTVFITGYRDAMMLSEASRRRPVDVMVKPLDVERVRSAVRTALTDRTTRLRTRRRETRLRRVARRLDRRRRAAERKLDATCADLTAAYRGLSGQMGVQQTVIAFQNVLLNARDDDDVFRNLFRMFVKRSGHVQGVALICDADAELQLIGRFGVPEPDGPAFCQALVRPVVSAVLAEPRCQVLDAGDEADRFDESIRKYLPGISILAVPLKPEADEMIGLVVLYRKGEQPFTDDDVLLAEMIAAPTAVAIRRNA